MIGLPRVIRARGIARPEKSNRSRMYRLHSTIRRGLESRHIFSQASQVPSRDGEDHELEPRPAYRQRSNGVRSPALAAG